MQIWIYILRYKLRVLACKITERVAAGQSPLKCLGTDFINILVDTKKGERVVVCLKTSYLIIRV